MNARRLAGCVTVVSAALLSLGVAVTHSGPVQAECTTPFGTDEEIDNYRGVAFEAVVTGFHHQPYSPAYGAEAYNWTGTLTVLDAITGEVPAVIVVQGHDAGCSTLDGLNLRMGDSLIITVDQLDMVEHPSLSQHVLVWRQRDGDWRFATGLLKWADRPGTYPREARDARTRSAIVRLVDPDRLPGTIVPTPSPAASPAASTMPGAECASPRPSLVPEPVASPGSIDGVDDGMPSPTPAAAPEGSVATSPLPGSSASPSPCLI